MTRFSLAAALTLLPTIALADTRLERFEDVAQRMNGLMADMMIAEIEAAGGDGTAIREASVAFPPWDDEMRAAAGCAIDGYIDASSANAVDDMIVRMDALIDNAGSMSMDEFSQMASSGETLPEGLTMDESFEINSRCGMTDLQIEAMQESGLMEAMMTAGRTLPGNN